MPVYMVKGILSCPNSFYVYEMLKYFLLFFIYWIFHSKQNEMFDYVFRCVDINFTINKTKTKHFCLLLLSINHSKCQLGFSLENNKSNNKWRLISTTLYMFHYYCSRINFVYMCAYELFRVFAFTLPFPPSSVALYSFGWLFKIFHVCLLVLMLLLLLVYFCSVVVVIVVFLGYCYIKFCFSSCPFVIFCQRLFFNSW